MSEAEKYDHHLIEKKWQDKWSQDGLYVTKDDPKKDKFYCLIEFPYPSAEGLHVGHPRSYTALDIVARKKRMEGNNVLFPIGFDAFGLPTENYAIKVKKNPADITKDNIERFRTQLKSLGLSFDWSREVVTTDTEYYKWTQWIFLQLYKKGLVYQSEMPINWCPSCKIGLANEEVVNGKCERCGTEVTKKNLKQWMFKITQYAQRLIDDLDTVDYLEKIKSQQINWIGRSEGAEVSFKIKYPRLAGNKTKHCLIVHGVSGHRRENWFPWLKNVLQEEGWQVGVPDLPATDHPVVNDWTKALMDSFSDVSTIVCHSLGAPAALNLIQETNREIDQLIMVAPVNPLQDWKHLNKEFPHADWDAIKKFADLKFDWKKIKQNVRKVVVYYSDDDPYISPESIDFYKKHIPEASFKLLPGKGHFNERKGIIKLPELLDDLIPSVKIFTTRPDTIFGATYLVLAPEHELVEKLKPEINNFEEVEKYIKASQNKSDLERTDLAKDKTGVELKGVKAINPASGEEIPVWVADYVLTGYGTGAIMAVPAHDERDFEFATKYKLPVIKVIEPIIVHSENQPHPEIVANKSVFAGEGNLINSGKYNGLTSFGKLGAKVKIIEDLKKLGLADSSVQYKLRDWIFSRQHYWGEPIPLVHCEKCGIVSVLEKDLPVELPKVKNYEPTETGESPLAGIKDWVNVKCPKCGGKAKRETDTMPNWAGSSWYFLRYTDPHNDKEFASQQALKYWTPVDLYNGGMEHTTLHLLYSRFWHKALYDLKLVPTSEPYQKRISHGMVLAEDGKKMSKSLGNVINPDDVVKEYGADTLRMYEMFMGPFAEAIPWDTKGIVGVRRFLDKVYLLGLRAKGLGVKGVDEKIKSLLHKTIKKVTEDINEFRFNTAVSALMILVNEMQGARKIDKITFEKLLLILSPFAPHLTEELWLQLGNNKSIHLESWPKFDPRLVKDQKIEFVIQINGKLKDKCLMPADVTEEDVLQYLEQSSKIQELIADKQVVKKIFVPGKLLNIVVK
ncbi:MAG: leucine--tRNA ligase [Patescibacteria group bacterium]